MGFADGGEVATGGYSRVSQSQSPQHVTGAMASVSHEIDEDGIEEMKWEDVNVPANGQLSSYRKLDHSALRMP